MWSGNKTVSVSAMNDSDWSKKIAVLIVDALVDAEIVSKSEVSRAADIGAEEIRIR